VQKRLTWEVLNIIGTIAFAVSGALVGMEEEYDIHGVFILPLLLIRYWQKYDQFFDAIGLAAFAIQRAMHAARLDESLAPNGCGTVVIMFKASPSASYYQQMGEQQYLQCKQEIDMKCREFLAAIDPIAGKFILFSEVATPRTVERYMKTYEGSIYSTKVDKENGFPSLQSPIDGLYLAGAGVAEGAGIEAVVITGATVAELIRSNEFTCV
jgi:phytoene dehydrogenase-like protein